MSLLTRPLRNIALAACLASPVMITGCAARVGVGYRVYDPTYRDYHRWDDREGGYYNRWTIETHRAPRREFRELHDDEQREYWNWRHNHGDRR